MDEGFQAVTITLSSRLQVIADWVPFGARLVDIGTDHAQLPIHLLLTQQIACAIAGDKARKPLNGAQLNKEKYRLTDQQLTLFHSDGMKNIPLCSSDVITMSGMGGKTMIEVLSSPKVDPSHRLILQPNRDVAYLRAFLSERRWKISDEKMIEENGQFYPTLLVAAGRQALSAEQAYLGPVLTRDRPVAWLRWLAKENLRFERISSASKGQMIAEKQRQWSWVKKQLSY